MVSDKRSIRIADRLKRELSLLFIQEISDPRLEDISITEVKLDRELAFADIFVTSLAGKEMQDEILRALEHASGYIRSQLANSISHLRSFPDLRFHWDPVPERVDRIEQIIAELEDEEGEIKESDE